VLARTTPRMVVAAATMTLLSSQRANGWSANREWKLETDRCAGQGMMARSRVRNPAPAGTSTIARLCPPDRATVSTQRIG